MSDAGRGCGRENASVKGNGGAPGCAPSGSKPPETSACVWSMWAIFEGPVSMTRRTLFQLPVEGLMGVGSSAALPFFNLLSACSMVDSDGESLIARSGYLPAVAGQLERRPRRIHGLLLQGFIVLINELHHQGPFLFREFTRGVAVIRLGRRAQIAAPAIILCTTGKPLSSAVKSGGVRGRGARPPTPARRCETGGWRQPGRLRSQARDAAESVGG